MYCRALLLTTHHCNVAPLRSQCASSGHQHVGHHALVKWLQLPQGTSLTPLLADDAVVVQVSSDAMRFGRFVSQGTPSTASLLYSCYPLPLPALPVALSPQ